jgi:hypothetical protein
MHTYRREQTADRSFVLFLEQTELRWLLEPGLFGSVPESVPELTRLRQVVMLKTLRHLRHSCKPQKTR